jgi:diaminohydroxyphosphoribosylaminopyrimidine deaminase / 5-amino-6-(5-phosphoribosylamino)uracil reductase
VSVMHERFMDLALEAGARGRTAPNPHVGAVIVRDGEVIAVGHHERAGEPHAEIAALRAAFAAGREVREATLYCTLEPCNHHGRTGPCVEAIVEAGIRRVVIGTLDPARHGREAGSVRLASLGVEVVTGIREQACRALIEDFACLVTKGRPLVVLKSAVTLDGRIATRSGDSKWITGPEARADAHALRAHADAVMVGVGTVLADDPQLNVRHVDGEDPVRVVLDAHLRTSSSARVVREAGGPTWIVHGPDAPMERRDALQGAGVTLIEVPAHGARLDLPSTLAALAERHVMRLLAEGGARISGALVETGLVDRVVIYVAPKLIGDTRALSVLEVERDVRSIAASLTLEEVEHRVLGADVRISGRVVRPA